MEKKKGKILEKFILICIQCIFYIKQIHVNKNERERLWKQKKEKYYMPLFYWISHKALIDLLPKLLFAEWNKQIKILPRVVFVISTRCTLKCKYCGEFIPYFDDKKDIVSEDVIRDLNCLFNRLDYICTLEFIGGEPFLHKDLDLFLKKANDYNFKIGKIEITTNATVKIPNRLIPLLQNKKVEVLISNYKVNAKYVNELNRFCKKNKIASRILNAKYWTDSGNIIQNGLTKENTYKMFMNCWASRDCRTLYKGRLLLCSRGPYMLEKGYFPNSLDIHMDNFCRNLYTFYLESGYDTCKYCRHNERKIPVAEQIENVCVHK